MIESPLCQEIVAEAKSEAMQRIVLDTLEDRFGPEAKYVEPQLKAVSFDQLRELARFARKCRSLASFRKRLAKA
jgi:hypothetical protein